MVRMVEARWTLSWHIWHGLPFLAGLLRHGQTKIDLPNPAVNTGAARGGRAALVTSSGLDGTSPAPNSASSFLHHPSAVYPKAMLNKSVRVELVETQSLQINNLQKPSTGSGRTERLVQQSPKFGRVQVSLRQSPALSPWHGARPPLKHHAPHRLRRPSRLFFK
jgi:hypothetical protein